MMKIKMSFESLKRVVDTVKAVLTPEAYVRIDFGNRLIKSNTEGIEDAMKTTVFTTNEKEQVEASIITSIPTEVERPLEECNDDAPLERVCVKADMFVKVAEVLLGYEQTITAETDASKLLLAVEGVAEMPIYRSDEKLMKILKPSRARANKNQLFDIDPELYMLRASAGGLNKVLKSVLTVEKKAPQALRHITCVARDAEPVYQEIEKPDGSKGKAVVSNAMLNMLTTDGSVIVNDLVPCVGYKGVQADILRALGKEIKEEDGKMLVDGKTCPVVAVMNSKEKTSEIIEYSEFKESYDKARTVASERIPYDPTKLTFFISYDVAMSLSKILAVAPDTAVRIFIGKKDLIISLEGVGITYVGSIYQGLNGDGKSMDFHILGTTYAALTNKLGNLIQFDGKGLASAIKLAEIYGEDTIAGHMPLEFELTKEGMKVKRGESQTFIKAISAESKADILTEFLIKDYASIVLSALPAGTISLCYGIVEAKNMPTFAFTVGSEKVISIDNQFVFCLGCDPKQAYAEAEKKIKEKEEEMKKKAEKAE